MMGSQTTGRTMGRRTFLQAGVFAGAVAKGFVSNEERRLLAGLDRGVGRNRDRGEHDTSTRMPMGKLGGVEISRLIAGGNLLSGWCHARDLLFVSRLAQAYLDERKQFETLQMMEENGINAITIDQDQLGIVNRYKRERGGKIKTVVCVRQAWDRWGEAAWEDLERVIHWTMDNGADILFTHGAYGDRAVESGKPERMELLAKAIDYIREMGYCAGLGSHSIYVPIECDKLGITPDFYFKTFHHDHYWSATPEGRRRKFCVDGTKHMDHNEFHDNIFCIESEKTLEYMRAKEQPWIGFKILAGGAISPKSGLDYAFENGVDFATVGMFDFDLIETAEAARHAIAGHAKRARPWRA